MLPLNTYIRVCTCICVYVFMLLTITVDVPKHTKTIIVVQIIFEKHTTKQIIIIFYAPLVGYCEKCLTIRSLGLVNI